jgi:predicted transcriptional regulator
MRKQLTVYIDEDLLDNIQFLAKDQETTVQSIIRLAIKEYMQIIVDNLKAEIAQLKAGVEADKQAAAAAHASSDGDAEDDPAPEPTDEPAEPDEPTDPAQHAAAA